MLPKGEAIVIGVSQVRLFINVNSFFFKPTELDKTKFVIPICCHTIAFITKHYKAWILIFLLLLFPAIYGNNHTKIYYNIAESLPETLDSNVANAELKKDFNMSNLHMVMMDKNMDAKQKKKMLEEIDEVKGVKWTISMNSLIGPTVPDSMIPDDMKEMLQSDDCEPVSYTHLRAHET